VDDEQQAKIVKFGTKKTQLSMRSLSPEFRNVVKYVKNYMVSKIKNLLDDLYFSKRIPREIPRRSVEREVSKYVSGIIDRFVRWLINQGIYLVTVEFEYGGRRWLATNSEISLGDDWDIPWEKIFFLDISEGRHVLSHGLDVSIVPPEHADGWMATAFVFVKYDELVDAVGRMMADLGLDVSGKEIVDRLLFGGFFRQAMAYVFSFGDRQLVERVLNTLMSHATLKNMEYIGNNLFDMLLGMSYSNDEVLNILHRISRACKVEDGKEYCLFASVKDGYLSLAVIQHDPENMFNVLWSEYGFSNADETTVSFLSQRFKELPVKDFLKHLELVSLFLGRGEGLGANLLRFLVGLERIGKDLWFGKVGDAGLLIDSREEILLAFKDGKSCLTLSWHIYLPSKDEFLINECLERHPISKAVKEFHPDTAKEVIERFVESGLAKGVLPDEVFLELFDIYSELALR